MDKGFEGKSNYFLILDQLSQLALLEPFADKSKVKILQNDLKKLSKKEVTFKHLCNLTIDFRLLTSTIRTLEQTAVFTDLFENSEEGKRIENLKQNAGQIFTARYNALTDAIKFLENFEEKTAINRLEIIAKYFEWLKEAPPEAIRYIEALYFLQNYKMYKSLNTYSVFDPRIALAKSKNLKLLTLENIQYTLLDGYRISGRNAFVKSALIKIYKSYDLYGSRFYEETQQKGTKGRPPKSDIVKLDYKTPIMDIFRELFEYTTSFKQDQMDNAYIYCLYKDTLIMDYTDGNRKTDLLSNMKNDIFSKVPEDEKIRENFKNLSEQFLSDFHKISDAALDGMTSQIPECFSGEKPFFPKAFSPIPFENTHSSDKFTE